MSVNQETEKEIPMKSRMRRSIVSALIVSVFSMSVAVPAHAGVVGTEAAADRERISAVLDREEVRAHLTAYGVDPAEVKARVAGLTDAEATRLAAEIDALPAGAGAEGAIAGIAMAGVGLVYVVGVVVGLVAVGIFMVGKAIVQGMSKSSTSSNSAHSADHPAPMAAQD